MTPLCVRAIVYRGLWRDTEVECDIELVTPEIGRTACIECEGTGDWTRFMPEPDKELRLVPCVECKGSGMIYVSI